MIDKTHHEKLMYNTFNIMKREREREKPRNMLHIVWRLIMHVSWKSGKMQHE